MLDDQSVKFPFQDYNIFQWFALAIIKWWTMAGLTVASGITRMNFWGVEKEYIEVY